MVIYNNINDDYCGCGNRWSKVDGGILFYTDYYYCHVCDEIYVPTTKKLSKEWIIKNYSHDRLSELIDNAKMVRAMEKVTYEDLIEMGYIKSNS